MKLKPGETAIVPLKWHDGTIIGRATVAADGTATAELNIPGAALLDEVLEVSIGYRPATEAPR